MSAAVPPEPPGGDEPPGPPDRRPLRAVTSLTEPVEALDELGFYALAGHTSTPRTVIAEARDGERLGLGSAFISERFNVKDAATLSGAVAAVTERIGVATAATNPQTRHPLVTATFGATMHALTGGRFSLGLGRGFDALFDVMGLPRVTSDSLVDLIGILRTLWDGGSVVGHEGPAGSFPFLHQGAELDGDIPVLLTAMGPRTLELAGRVADAVVLHTFFSDAALERSVAAVRRGAEEAGRDPAAVRVWSVLATVGDHLDEEARLRKLVGRLATYLQGYGDLMVRVNDWDPAVLARFREAEVVTSATGALDATATVAELEAVAELLPEEWMAASAQGPADRCAATVVDQLRLGADSVILHGATPAELAPVVEAYRLVRPTEAVARCTANPGWLLP
ncbi:TIGR03857 family LLM class F420-dependent oxidoreductase [Iamia majanohamensis]|uniref:TIGR03857 family LLM class F420-dependent oxidoreductase n=1 Tax=Iamia majanohamensis TaxID=467976 RepID=A0AAF0BS28_9ACTN|nr:TIGR03857 family LLM class F420-dependent oxidoreductase [Iamia majanohamensis]WCO67611.1 TIGR03857 family LLM class F420-dependent oxidoreductase [Iamia majanohamensis]